MNIKKPPDFLQGTSLYQLTCGSTDQRTLRRLQRAAASMATCWSTRPRRSASAANLGRTSSSGPAVVEDGVRLVHPADGVRVCSHAVVMDSILGWRSTVGSWARVEGVFVLGEDVHIDPELCINGALILPHKTIGDSVATPQIIMRARRPRLIPADTHGGTWKGMVDAVTLLALPAPKTKDTTARHEIRWRPENVRCVFGAGCGMGIGCCLRLTYLRGLRFRAARDGCNGLSVGSSFHA